MANKSSTALKPMSIMETIENEGNLDTFFKAIKSSGIEKLLQGSKPCTIFAPIDSAFEQLGKRTIDELFKTKEELATFISNHIASGKYKESDLSEENSLETISGTSLAINALKGIVINNSVNVIESDIECTNGIIHIIDSVL